LLFLPMLASAEHHRGHAIAHLDGAINWLDSSIGLAALYRDNNADTELQVKRANKYVIYATKYRNRMSDALSLLSSGGDLDEVRRLMNAPGIPGKRESALWGVTQIVAIINTMITEDAPNLARLKGVLRLQTKSAGLAGYALWHVNDAIREEIYQDPEFQ
ncbi:unnamed protein product, partial [marine sediment metagenome]